MLILSGSLIICIPGPSCSKLTTSLVNDSLKFTSNDTANMLKCFAEKMLSSFCSETKWPLTCSLSQRRFEQLGPDHYLHSRQNKTQQHLYLNVRKHTFGHVRTMMTQISQHLRVVWSESSLSARRNLICLWLGPPLFSYWFSFTLAYCRISHEYSSLFIIVINLIFMFSLWCIDWVGSLYANRIFMYFCIKSSIGTHGEVG